MNVCKDMVKRKGKKMASRYQPFPPPLSLRNLHKSLVTQGGKEYGISRIWISESLGGKENRVVSRTQEMKKHHLHGMMEVTNNSAIIIAVPAAVTSQNKSLAGYVY